MADDQDFGILDDEEFWKEALKFGEADDQEFGILDDEEFWEEAFNFGGVCSSSSNVTNQGFNNAPPFPHHSSRLHDEDKEQEINLLRGIDLKKKGSSGLARVVKVDYERLTDQEKQEYAGEAVVGQKKAPYCVICDVNYFIKFLDEIPQINKEKLGDSPFAHFLNLKNKKLQVDQVGVTLSLCLQDNMNLQLLSKGMEKEDMEVTKEHFSALMGIVDMDPISDNQNIEESIEEKFCIRSKKNKWEDIFLTKVKDVLKDVNEDENHIKRAFALIAMHYIVCPPKRTTLGKHMLRYVNDVNALKRQRWASLAISKLLKGRYDGKGKTKIIGGCVFFLQLYLMWKQDKGLELLKIDEEQIKKFKLKWEQDYGHQSALKGFLQPLVNKIVRDMQEVRKIIEDKKNPINLKYLMDIDETLAKVMSEAAALESQEDKSDKSAPESVRDRAHGSDQLLPDESEQILQEDRAAALEIQEDVSRPKGKRKKNQYQGKIVGDKRLTRREAQKQGIHPIESLK